MDGLMFDTERMSSNIVKEVAAIMGLPVSDEYLLSLKGRNMADCRRLQKAYWGENMDFVTYRSLYEERRANFLSKNGVPVKEGLYELMDYLKAHDIRIGLATSTAEDRAVAMLKDAKVHHFFHQIVYGNEVSNGKPAPDIYLACARRLGTKPSECLVLEDSPAGIESGYRAGCHVIMIPDMIKPSNQEESRTDAILPTLRDVIDWIALH